MKVKSNFDESLFGLARIFNQALQHRVTETTGSEITGNIKKRMLQHRNYQGKKVNRYSQAYLKRKRLSPWQNLGGSLIEALTFSRSSNSVGSITFVGRHRKGKTNKEIASYILKGTRESSGRDFFKWHKRSNEHKHLMNMVKAKILKGW